MKNILLAGSLALVSVVSVNAQVSPKVCGASEMIHQAMDADPSYRHSLQALEQFTQQYISTHQAERTSGVVLYVIPVVFHIIHNYGPENISKAQVLDAVDIMNKSFQKYYSDSVDVASVFRPIIADAQIEFRLAQLDPNGDCTDGITRTVSTLTYSAGDNVKGLVDWPSDKYFNIWVVSNIASGAAGYAYYPGIASNIDGVVMLHDYTGGIGTSNGSNYSARSLTHECGHWLNLAHTWGSTNSPGVAANCNDDDFVQDTPNTIGVANFSCDTTQVTCSTVDNVQNYMDYASCHLMFTEGQKARMHAALNSPSGSRNNLYTQANLIATGTNDGFIPTPCAPVADFGATQKYLCAGSTYTFHDVSWKGDVVTRQWDFPGGTPSSSTDADPVIQYNTPGIYSVTLTVSNSAGSSTVTRNDLIIVSSNPASNFVPFTESFENITSVPSSSDWLVENNGGNAWEINSAAAYTGAKSIRLVNFSGNPTAQFDAFVTPGFNLTNITGASLKFKLSFAPRSASSTDGLKVYASNDCGQNWSLRYTKIGLNLSTAGIISSNFVPGNTSQWREETVNINNNFYNNKPAVRFKFEYQQGNGNNIYIDDINVTGTSTVGIQDVDFLSTISVYPNPSQGMTSVQYNLSGWSDVKIDVMDIAGRKIASVVNERQSSGSHKYNIGENWPSGIYFINFSIDGGTMTEKLVITR